MKGELDFHEALDASHGTPDGRAFRRMVDDVLVRYKLDLDRDYDEVEDIVFRQLERMYTASFSVLETLRHYIRSHFYIYNELYDNDREYRVIIEEAKAQYEISVRASGMVYVDADTDSGAAPKRATQIKAELNGVIK